MANIRKIEGKTGTSYKITVTHGRDTDGKAPVLAWDPDFTKLTPEERRDLEEARAEEETVAHDEINWD